MATDEPVHLTEMAETGDRFLVYATSSGLRVDVRYEGETLWMTQAQMSDLFGVGVTTVNEHLMNVYREGELEEEPTIRNYRIVRSEGGRQVAREVNHYNLDAVISVGYRVSSMQGTLFRKWATGVLVRFATKGFVVDVERLKAPEAHDRVAELRDIVRDIRSSEANVYAELRRICALCQDYDPQSLASRDFYKNMQAKLFWAVTNHTPAMIVRERADAAAPNMGLRVWARDEIVQADVTTAKNYLGSTELKELNRLTTLLLDIFDDQLSIGRLTLMSQATDLLDTQLRNLNRNVLRHGGNVKHDTAVEYAKAQYKRFDKARKVRRRNEVAAELAALKEQEKALPKATRRGAKAKSA